MQRVADEMKKSLRDPKTIYKERIERLIASTSLKTPDRVPIVIHPGLWACSYANISFQEAMYDHRRLAWAYERLIQDFDWDATSVTGIYDARQWEVLGSTQYAVPGRDLRSDFPFQVRNKPCMEPEDYDYLIEDPYRFTLEVALRRICTEVNKPYPRNVIALIKGAIEHGKNREFWRNTVARWIEEYGMPPAVQGITYAPLDWLADYLRGFDRVCLDMRRMPEKVKAACDAILPYNIRVGHVTAGDPKWKTQGWPPLFIPLHIAPYLSPRQFEEFYWPTFKKLVDKLVEMGHLLWIFFESDWTRYLEYVKELPKARIVAHFEFTDLRKAKDVLSDRMCIAGNVSVTLLSVGTPAQVREKCKELLNGVAEGGGYIMTTGQILSADVRVENAHALTDFTRSCGIYRG